MSLFALHHPLFTLHLAFKSNEGHAALCSSSRWKTLWISSPASTSAASQTNFCHVMLERFPKVVGGSRDLSSAFLLHCNNDGCTFSAASSAALKRHNGLCNEQYVKRTTAARVQSSMVCQEDGCGQMFASEAYLDSHRVVHSCTQVNTATTTPEHTMR